MRLIDSVAVRRFGSSFFGAGVLAAGFLACTGPEPQGATHAAQTSTIQGALIVADSAGLPTCNQKGRGTVFYVTASQTLVYCNGNQYVPIDLRGLDGKDGRDGVHHLVSISPATPEECATGGVSIKVGPDANRDAIIDTVTASAVVCNGAPGPQGATGAAGPAGPAGANGANGSTSLIRQATEPAGANCPAGGTRIDTGVDDNGNGVLEDAEVDQTTYVCASAADPCPFFGLTACGGVCRDTVNDVKHCGACGNHCQNGGTCAGSACQCAAGFTGTACEINIDECASNPCLNGGTCTDGVNAFTCACATGFSGSRCETNINDCASNPCPYGKTCVDGIASYTCEIAWQDTGTDASVDDCAPNLCPNGGICTDGVGRYACECAPGYTGTGCRYFVQGDVVLDTATNLKWQRTVTYASWSNAMAYCEALSLDGTGWRLPSPGELASIVDNAWWPKIDSWAFPGTPADWFYTSSTSYWYGDPLAIHFGYGSNAYSIGAWGAHVRCVR